MRTGRLVIGPKPETQGRLATRLRHEGGDFRETRSARGWLLEAPTTSWSLGDVAPTSPALSGPVLSAVVCGLGSLTGTRCFAGSLELTTSLFLQHKTAYFIPGAALS